MRLRRKRRTRSSQFSVLRNDKNEHPRLSRRKSCIHDSPGREGQRNDACLTENWELRTFSTNSSFIHTRETFVQHSPNRVLGMCPPFGKSCDHVGRPEVKNASASRIPRADREPW